MSFSTKSPTAVSDSMRSASEAIASLDAYLRTWTDASGGVHGYIIHHHRDYAVVTAPACWTQGVRILGHLKLYEKTGERGWLEAAELESRYLVGAYCERMHLYHDSTTPLTLINNAWPTLGLVKTAHALRSDLGSGWQRMIQVARDNLYERILAEHWDPTASTFYFCPPEYPGRRVHTYNQTAIALSALCAMAEFSGDESLVSEYAIPAADHMIRMQDKSGPLKGGWGYNDGESAHLYYYLYTALNCRGLLDIYEHTHETRFLESAGLAGDHLAGMIDPHTKLFCHRYVRAGRRVLRFVHPTMVATSGLGLLQIRRLREHGFNYDIDESIERLVDAQMPHGGFPSFIGATDIWTPGLFPSEPAKRKWRDMVSVPFWNVFVFELLADLLPRGQIITNADVRFPLRISTDDGLVLEEDVDHVRLVRADTGRTVSYFEKKRDYMLFSTEKMRGVPFGAFANSEQATILKLKKRIRVAIIAGAILLVTVLAFLLAILL